MAVKEEEQVEVKDLTGVQRSAILLMAMGEEHASEILKSMGPKEVQSVGTAMSHLAEISKDQVKEVLDGFINDIGGRTALGLNADDYLRNVFSRALGDDKANNLIDRIFLGRNSKGIESLKWMDSNTVADLVRLEHPQIIAIVMSYLEPDHAANILSRLPERVRPDVVMRIATMDGIQPSALMELDDIIEKQTSGTGNVQSTSVGGIKVAAEILNFVGGVVESDIINKIEEADSDLSTNIEESMFVFENLVDLDDRGMQALLRDVTNEMLMKALRGAEEALKDKFLRNMSKRAADMLRDDMESMGPTKLSEVEDTQKEVVSIARKMADAGDIQLGGSGEELV
jgi:flagellar motor switch protein FliG